MKTVAYIRVSGSKQDIESQKMTVMKFAEKERFFVDEYFESVVSTQSRKQVKEFQTVLSSLGEGDYQ